MMPVVLSLLLINLYWNSIITVSLLFIIIKIQLIDEMLMVIMTQLEG